jgi:hypothetical protein
MSMAPTIGPTSSAGAGAIPSFDLAGLGAIAGLDSYQSSFTAGGVLQYKTITVTKPVLSKDITQFSADGKVATRIIVVGDKAWSAQGADGKFSPIPAAMSASLLAAFDPATLLGGYASYDWAHASSDKGLEQKNGIQARHLRLDATSPGAAFLPAGASIDVWVADAGYLVAWEMSGFGANQDVSIEVTNINDPANKVETPAG